MKRADKYPDIDTRSPNLYRTVLETAVALRAERAMERLVDEARSPRFAYRCKHLKTGHIYMAIE